MSSVDPISRDVFQHQIEGIAEEMSMALRRAAFSSIIWDMYDYACGLLTPEGDLLAQSNTIPAQLGLMATAVQHVFAEIPREEWKAGDVLVCNDPYRGCTHTMDVCLFSPVIHDGEMIAIASTIAHHVDIGGKVPGSEGPDNIEVFGEGLLLPPLKLVEEGRQNPAIFKIIAANVRDPEASAGDLRAQIAGCGTGERRMIALAKLHGDTRFRELCDACLDYNETFMRRAISQLEDGAYEAEIRMENDVTSDEPIPLRVTVTVRGDEIEIDLTRSSDQLANGLNCPIGSTIAMVHYAVKAVIAPELTQNQGCNRPVAIHTRKGSIFDPERPAAVSVRHLSQQALADLVLKALVPIAGENAAAGCHVSFPSFVAGGFDDRPDMAEDDGSKPYYVISDIIGGGMGGYAGGDGLSAVDTHGGNCALLSAEVMESLSPVRVLRTALVQGSGGDGKFRGGLAVERDYQVLSESAIFTGYNQQTRPDTAPWGYAGGKPGGLAAIIRNPGTPKELNLKSKMVGLKLDRGDVLRTRSAGGGGWGLPDERAEDARARDREEELV